MGNVDNACMQAVSTSIKIGKFMYALFAVLEADSRQSIIRKCNILRGSIRAGLM